MDKQKVSKDFIESAFTLGEELLKKDNLVLTNKERDFLNHLDKMLELLEESQK